eukprot:9793310-Ditylum_brightwellii.AAC.2
MRGAHLLGRKEVKAPPEGENSKWCHSLSQAKHIMHEALTNQAALVTFLRKQSINSSDEESKESPSPPHLPIIISPNGLIEKSIKHGSNWG